MRTRKPKVWQFDGMIVVTYGNDRQPKRAIPQGEYKPEPRKFGLRRQHCTTNNQTNKVRDDA